MTWKAGRGQGIWSALVVVLYTPFHKGSIISMWFKNKIESHDAFSENFADHFHNMLCFSDET
jgi:hypothetical protein